MKGVISFICSIYLLLALTNAAAIPEYFQRLPITRRSVTADQIRRELGYTVSNKTEIFGPDDPSFNNATSRWNDFAAPQIQVVIIPGQRSDISTIVKYCNKNSFDFLAINHGHGSTASLGKFNGIQINMAQLQQIDIQPDSQSAWFGGGTYDGQVVEYLWQKGYVTTTGSCDCVGMMGPGLGGGLGRHSGLYGLISDNIIELDVVLASGEQIRVSSNSNTDLLWGMKGAGHNFGIVTRFRLKIYPRGPATWHYHNYVWRRDKVEAVFKALNDIADNNGTPPDLTTNFGNFLMNTTIVKDEPVIWWTFAYRGSAEEAEKILAPFNAIESAYEEQDDVPFPTIAVAQQTDVNAFICQNNFVRITETSFLKTYNLTAERQIFDSFQRTLKQYPAVAAGADILHEGYSNKGILAISGDTSAYPWRGDQHLNLVQIIVDPNDKQAQQHARDWAVEIRDYWDKGSPQPGNQRHIYVNYANGFEPVADIYGQEPWRMQRLAGLKKKYDPNNRFRYYNPIISPSPA